MRNFERLSPSLRGVVEVGVVKLGPGDPPPPDTYKRKFSSYDQKGSPSFDGSEITCGQPTKRRRDFKKEKSNRLRVMSGLDYYV